MLTRTAATSSASRGSLLVVLGADFLGSRSQRGERVRNNGGRLLGQFPLPRVQLGKLAKRCRGGAESGSVLMKCSRRLFGALQSATRAGSTRRLRTSRSTPAGRWRTRSSKSACRCSGLAISLAAPADSDTTAFRATSHLRDRILPSVRPISRSRHSFLLGSRLTAKIIPHAAGRHRIGRACARARPRLGADRDPSAECRVLPRCSAGQRFDLVVHSLAVAVLALVRVDLA